MGKLKFILIVFVFILPFFLANYFYQSNVTDSIGTSNYGNFLNQEIFLEEHVSNQNSNWIILQLLPTKCNENCEQTTYLLRQINIALGKDMDRVKRHILFKNNDVDETKYLNNYPKVIVLRKSETLYNTLAKMSETIFIVDPFGRIILGYNSDFNGKMLLKDLKKLLKYSKI